MIALRSPVQNTRKTHKKQNSSDSINSQRRRKFLSVVSSESIMPKTAIHLQHQRKISELKKQAMGEITNHHPEQRPAKEVQLKIRRVSANPNSDKPQEKGVNERMILFKRRLANLVDLQDSSKENATAQCVESGLQTPINRLLYESVYRQAD